MANSEFLTQLGSTMAGIMFIWAMIQQYLPTQFRYFFEAHAQKLLTLISPYIHVLFHEYSGNRFKKSEAYASIEIYLGVNSSSRAKRFKADFVQDSQSVVLSMDDYVEVTDEFKGVKVWWSASKTAMKSQSISFYPASDEKRCYRLKFHRKDRNIITDEYISYVIKEGKALSVKQRQRKLYTNCRNDRSWETRSMWSHVQFEHPASFGTLAMEPSKKNDIMNDLLTFRNSKAYYKKIGKAWKRGYLLYGPPGTGKSTMIAAMANLLEYDIYDLELTSVKDNTELRKLLIETTSKSIMVIEDIDCSLDLTGQRKKQDKEEDGTDKDVVKKAVDKELDKAGKTSEVTLSGLLNFVDGLWSACGGERIIVFTTNYVEKLDPALIRRGRMDKHIELSYCCFEAFKVLARNYLDVEEHKLFDTIKKMLDETDITPADVAESLMPKYGEDDVDACLDSLVRAIETAKEEAKLKAEADEKKKAEEEEKAKTKKDDKEKEDEKKKLEVKENDVAKENGIVEENEAHENSE